MKSFYQRRRSLGATLFRSEMDQEIKVSNSGVKTRYGGSGSTLPPPPQRRRSSLAQILFGSNGNTPSLSPSQSYGTLKLTATSQSSLITSGSATTSKLGRRRSRPSIAIPVDSREKHNFYSSEEASEDEAFVDDDVFQQPLAESVDTFLASKQTDRGTWARHHDRRRSGMPRPMRVVVAGGKKTGKTALLQQLACYNDITGQQYVPTIDDTYQIQTQHDSQNSRPKEVIIFHDTAGISDYGSAELKKPYLQVADAFLLVYSVLDHESFNRMDSLKKAIEKQYNKDRKDVIIAVVGTMTDLAGRTVDAEFANTWAGKEKVKWFEVSSKNRSTLVDIVHYLVGRHFYPIKESKFSLSKKLKPEKSTASSQQILTDI